MQSKRKVEYKWHPTCILFTAQIKHAWKTLKFTHFYRAYKQQNGNPILSLYYIVIYLYILFKCYTDMLCNRMHKILSYLIHTL